MEVDRDDQLFDIESYANIYSGHGKVNRLLFVANATPDPQLRLEAQRLAADELKKGEDITRYFDVTNAINGRLGPAYDVDKAWIEKTRQAANRRQENLENDLNAYKTNLIKESIRLGHNELGNHHYARGQLMEAFKCYVRTRDYCTTSKHHWSACLNAIRVGIELGQFSHVSNYIIKAEQQPGIKSHPDVMSKLAAAAGLAHMDAKNYRAAARKFTEVGAELGSQWNCVIAPPDIALYGVLCGLAHFDRSELKRDIIDNVQFREYLEVYPEVREVVNNFYGSKYATCLNHLQRLEPLLSLDLFLSPHAKDLCAAVRSKALVQYTAPFVSVHLPTMASAFNLDGRALEDQIADLIQDGKILARIDSGSQVLYKRRANLRSATFSSALRSAEEHVRETRALLLRASLQRHDVIQKGGGPGYGRRNRGGGRGGVMRGGRGDRHDREDRFDRDDRGWGSAESFLPGGAPGTWMGERGDDFAHPMVGEYE